MQQWFNNLTRQEQLLVLLGASLVAAYLLFTVLWRPMSHSAAELALQNKNAEKSLLAVNELAAEYKQLQKTGPANVANKQNLTRLIDSSVKKNQLMMSRFQPSASGDVQLRFEHASFNNILAWLNELETDNGVIVKDLSISHGNAVGLVNVSVRLRRGG